MKEIKIKPQNKNELKFEKRSVFSDKYDYETFDFALCAICAYFQNGNTNETVEWAGKNACGKCRLAKAMGAYDGVMATAVCNKFLSHIGTDINGKKITPRQIPSFIKLVKNEKGKTSVVLTV